MENEIDKQSNLREKIERFFLIIKEPWYLYLFYFY